jgi:hypothetical protein
MKPGILWHGDCKFEWEQDGRFRIARQSTAQAVELSLSEVVILRMALDLCDRPSAPPTYEAGG